MTLSVWDTLKEEEKLAEENTRTFGQVKRRFEFILFCLISCTKVKACVLAFIVTWCEECGRKKRRKRWRNKRKGHSAIWWRRSDEWREVLVSETEDSAVLENCVSESKQKRREKYREQEKIVRDTQWGREQWVKRKRELLYSSCISKCCNLYLIE